MVSRTDLMSLCNITDLVASVNIVAVVLLLCSDWIVYRSIVVTAHLVCSSSTDVVSSCLS